MPQRAGLPPTVGSGHPLADILLVKYQPHYLEVNEGVVVLRPVGIRDPQEHGDGWA